MPGLIETRVSVRVMRRTPKMCLPVVVVALMVSSVDLLLCSAVHLMRGDLAGARSANDTAVVCVAQVRDSVWPFVFSPPVPASFFPTSSMPDHTCLSHCSLQIAMVL
jgi:hypothetical protein